MPRIGASPYLGRGSVVPASPVRLQLGAAHLDKAITGLAVKVVIGEEVHPAGFLLAAVPAGDQFTGGPTGVGEVVVAAGGGIRVRESGQDGCPYSRRGGVAGTAGGLAEGNSVRRMAPARGLEERSPRMWAHRGRSLT
ncbi:hypothetical protein SHKM778_04100 [Streptomyces sp. KM77-8]|uniref:Uncharacterized protein n=1 Tax=Streptomyces haneummycinicus TaxID=3074435 RepID=A0AAT9H9F5_9ACTN